MPQALSRIQYWEIVIQFEEHVLGTLSLRSIEGNRDAYRCVDVMMMTIGVRLFCLGHPSSTRCIR
eukprot:1158744-Pelagomonas_calceolata.AAC.13